MRIENVLTDTSHLADPEIARQLGRRLWTENDLQLDFSDIDSVTEEFATELCRTIIQQRDPALLHHALMITTMAPPVQATFFAVLSAALSGSLGSTPASGAEALEAGSGTGEDLLDLRHAFNPISALRSIQAAYLQYVYTFQKFTNPNIAGWVEEKIRSGTLLWREPYIQLTRRFETGDTFANLVQAGTLHPETPRYFTDGGGKPIRPHHHQSDAIKNILDAQENGANTIVATGTGSGKSFCFGIPIVSECLRLRGRGVHGIKAIIIYPMNALGNSQYADFARRLHGSGLKLALYTGDTLHNPDEALIAYREATGRDQPYDSELISREEIQQNPPDILMTNYVMLELLLTRFEDRRLFPPWHAGVLRFLVLDEVHTYTGKQGADVACLIRRLKQHTNTTGKLRCIATSATISSEDEQTATRLISDFAGRLFGESFDPAQVVGEMYRATTGQSDTDLAPDVTISEKDITHFDGSFETAVSFAEKLLGRSVDLSNGASATEQAEDQKAQWLAGALTNQATLYFLEEKLTAGPASLPHLVEAYQRVYRPDTSHEAVLRELTAALLVGTIAQVTEADDQSSPRLVPRLHAFFSQGRAIVSCLTHEGPHLSDRGDLTCPTCANQLGRERSAFPMNFCRACGQEYYSVTLQDDGTLQPYELDAVDYDGTPFYIYSGALDQINGLVPDNWLTPAGNVRQAYRDNVPLEQTYCPVCNRLDPDCDHADRLIVMVMRAPFLLCLNCGIVHDRRPREFNKLFTFGTVGRSTATDVLISNTLNNLPRSQRKVIAFSDNRQDTALQAAHLNSLQRRIQFRRALFQALQQAPRPLPVGTDLGLRIYDTMEATGTLPRYWKESGRFRQQRRPEIEYRQYLTAATLLDLEATHRRVHQNLEDVGLLVVEYDGLAPLAAAAGRCH